MKKLIILFFIAMSFATFAQNNCPPNVNHFDFYFNTPVYSGQKVGGVSYCDPDSLDQTDTWSIDQIGNLFDIMANGNIIVVDPTTINTNGTYVYNVTVTITDNGTPPLSNLSTITFYATKPNEPPVIIEQ